jgi:hypothetical protein
VASLRVQPLRPVILRAGEEAPLAVKVRRENCPGQVELTLDGLPAGVKALPAYVEAGADSARVTLRADPGANAAERRVTVMARSGNLADAGRFGLTVVAAAPQPNPHAAEVRKSSSSGRSVTADGRTFRAVDLGEGRGAVQCSDRDGRLLWSCQVNGVSRLALPGTTDRVYGITSDQLVCFDVRTGKWIWQVRLGSAGVLVEAAPDGSRVFVATRTELRAFSADTGKELWRLRGIDQGKSGGALSLSMDAGKGELVLRWADGSEFRFDARDGRAIK